MTQERNKITLTRNVLDCIIELPLEAQAQLLKAIHNHCLNFTEVHLTGIAKGVFQVIKPELDKGNAQYLNGTKSKQNKTPKKTPPPTTNKKFNKADFRKTLIQLGAKENYINDWFAARDKKKSVYTKTALDRDWETMAIQKVEDKNKLLSKVELHPKRTYISGSWGVSGSIYVFPNRSETQKDNIDERLNLFPIAVSGSAAIVTGKLPKSPIYTFS